MLLQQTCETLIRIADLSVIGHKDHENSGLAAEHSIET